MTIGGVEYEFTATPRGAGARGGGTAPAARKVATGNLPPLPDEYKTMIVTPCKFWTKDGVSAPKPGRDGKMREGRPWTVFIFRDMDDEDVSFATFDVELGALAEKLCKAGKQVRVAYTQGDRGFQFVGLPQSEAEPEGESEPAAQEQSDPETPPPSSDTSGKDDDLPW